MHDKLKLFLSKINLKEEYYKYFNDGKILKLKLDPSRKNGVFVIEIENTLDDEVLRYINENISSGFPDMESIKAEFVVRNVDYKTIVNYFPDAIDNSTLTKPMKELFKEKKVSVDGTKLTIDVDNIAEENIFRNHLDSILNHLKRLGFKDVVVDVFINEENAIKVKKELEEEIKKKWYLNQKKRALY